MSSPPKPRLVAVESAPEEAPAPPPRPQRKRPQRTSVNLLWIGLGLLAIAAAYALWIQTQRVSELTVHVETLSSDLAVARGEIEAYETRMGEVRSSVAGLREQITALDVLVSADPLAPELREAP